MVAGAITGTARPTALMLPAMLTVLVLALPILIAPACTPEAEMLAVLLITMLPAFTVTASP